MILQALVDYYKDLERKGEIASPGWNVQKVSFAAQIGENGELLRLISLKTEQQKGKKTVLMPQNMNLPTGVKKTSGVKSNFLWENAKYCFGLFAPTEEKKQQERTVECFQACAELHRSILGNTEHPAVTALLRFFESWKPSEAWSAAALQSDLDELMKGGNIVFLYEGEYLHTIPCIRQAWQKYSQKTEKEQKIRCLVTGQTDTLALLHPSIKGVRDAQSSGASLVSFNAPAFESFGQEQGANAPTGSYAAFAYGAALNYLLAHREYVHLVGNTTVMCWAKGAEQAYQGLMGICGFGDPTSYTQDEITEILKLLTQGKSVTFDETRIDPETPFYILGLSPNAARLSVRFFYRNSFGTIIRNIQEHQERLEIARSERDQMHSLSLWGMLNETVNQNARDKTPSPELAGELVRAVLENTRYPATLLNGVTLRIRADHKINSNRAAILKAYYLKNKNPFVPEEVLTVALNPDSSNVPYQLGRLFSVLENIQETANPGINSTIRDKYFNSASATPAVVFPTLVNLAQKHLKKIGRGLRVTLDRQMQEIINSLPENYPSRLSLPEQGSFQLGYYHQTVVRYQRKNKEEK